jgi:hypothetical protein
LYELIGPQSGLLRELRQNFGNDFAEEKAVNGLGR